MAGRVTERSVDDVGDQALSYSEVKALATGNPLIMERAGIETELAKLSRLHAAHRNDQGRLTQRVRAAERDADDSDRLAGIYRTAAARAVDTTGDRFTIDIAGRSYQERAEAAGALQAAMLDTMTRSHAAGRCTTPLGELAGFTATVTVSRDATETTAALGLEGVPRHTRRCRDRRSARPPRSACWPVSRTWPATCQAEPPRRTSGPPKPPPRQRKQPEGSASRSSTPAASNPYANASPPSTKHSPPPNPPQQHTRRTSRMGELVERAEHIDNQPAHRARPPLDPAVSLTAPQSTNSADVVYHVPAGDGHTRSGPVDMAVVGDAVTDIAYPNNVTGDPGPDAAFGTLDDPATERQNLSVPSDELGG